MGTYWKTSKWQSMFINGSPSCSPIDSQWPQLRIQLCPTKISFCGIPNSRNVLFLQIVLKRAEKPSAGNTSAGFPWTKRTQILLNLTWLCIKASQTFSGTFSRTFSGTLLNLTWLCTEASQTFSASDLLRNLFRNPVEPDLSLAPRPSPEPSSEPSSEPWWTWPGFASKLPRPSPEPSPEPCWTWPGSAPKPPEPSPEPCWRWPGFAPKPPRPSPEHSEASLQLRWTWPGACTSAHQSYSGLTTPSAYAVGEKTGSAISILYLGEF